MISMLPEVTINAGECARNRAGEGRKPAEHYERVLLLALTLTPHRGHARASRLTTRFRQARLYARPAGRRFARLPR